MYSHLSISKKTQVAPSESSRSVAGSSLPDSAIHDYFFPLNIYTTAPTAINPQ